jgi:hypothetical protein
MAAILANEHAYRASLACWAWIGYGESQRGSYLWRGSLLPPGRESTPITATEFRQAHRIRWFCDGCAVEREQAPSPQAYVILRGVLNHE